MECPQCARDIPSDAVLCSYCGIKLSSTARITLPRRRRTLIWGTLGVLLLAGVLVGAPFVCTSSCCVLSAFVPTLPPTDTATPGPSSTPTPPPPATPTQAREPMGTPTPITLLEWEGIYIGMPADDVLKIHPKSETTEPPVELGRDSEGLVVRWSYPDVYLVFALREGEGTDSLGMSKCYRVTEIQLRTDALSPTSTPRPTNVPRPTLTPRSTSTPTPEPTSTPERTEAQVVKVVDGDTISVEYGGNTYSLRYIGIDCPETVHPSKPVEWMGAEAAEANRQLVEGKAVYLEKDVSETDQYGRLLRYVFLADGTFVNAELVRLGYAQASTYPPDVKYQDLFLEMQQEAREAGRGLWGPTPTPVPPTLTPAPPTVAAVPPTPVPATPGDVRITYVYYDGQVPRVESDEYAVVKNIGGSPVNLGGWRLNADDPGQDFWFPDFILQPGQECRVYTNEYHQELCGFSFGSGKAIWNNKGDCGHLYNANGDEVSTYCY